jgi:hypothetical protein
MITLEDVHEFGHRWFDTVGRGGSAEDQAAFFLDKHARIYIVWNGVTFSLEEHHKLHAQWIDERRSVHRPSVCAPSARYIGRRSFGGARRRM